MYLQLIPSGMIGLGLTLLFIAVAGRSRVEQTRAERAHQQRLTQDTFPELVDADLWEEQPIDLELN